MSRGASVRADVIWINWAFGVGKTEVVKRLQPRLPSTLVLDPEPIGSLLRRVVPGGRALDDFQDLPAWRRLTRIAVASLARTGRCAIVPMTIVDPRYFQEVVGTLGLKLRVAHFTLVAPAETIAARLRGLPGPNDWALARVDRCVARLAATQFAIHVDADRRSPDEIADEILERLGEMS